MIAQWMVAILVVVSGLSYVDAVATNTLKLTDVVVTSTEIFSNLFGSGSLTYTETFTFSSAPQFLSSYGTASGTCDSHSMGSTSSYTERLSIETDWATNTTTASITIPVTTTSILPVSTLTITISAVNTKSTATGLCYWGEEAILTPCTDLVAATAGVSTTQKSAAISRGGHNIFQPVVKSFKNIFSFSFRLREQNKITARFEMFGHQWDDDCYKVSMIWSPIVCLCCSVFFALFLFYNWESYSLWQNVVNTAVLLLLIPVMAIVTFAELSARPMANIQNWWTQCRESYALPAENPAGMCQAADNTEPDVWGPMALLQTS